MQSPSHLGQNSVLHPRVEEKVNHENNTCIGTIISVPHIMHNNISARSYTIKGPE